MRREGWCLPGGKQDDGETIKSCAKREVEEETGIVLEQITNMVFLGKSIAVSGRTVYVYFSKVTSDKVKISSEHSEYKWVEWDEVKTLKLAGNTGKFLQLLKPYEDGPIFNS